jgi:hypothetical protein
VRSFSVFSILVLICTDIIPIDGEDCLNKIPDYSKVIFAEVSRSQFSTYEVHPENPGPEAETG